MIQGVMPYHLLTLLFGLVGFLLRFLGIGLFQLIRA
jgi:hypothetical protein